MKQRKLTVRKIREILRLHYSESNISNRQISSILRISKTTVKQCPELFESSGLNWPLSEDLKDSELYTSLYKPVTPQLKKTMPDWSIVHKEPERFNARPMQKYKVPGKERFLELDKPYAKPIPRQDFPYVFIKPKATVHKDYHVEYNKHYYNVPYNLCGEKVEVWQTNFIIEIFHNHERVASHKTGIKEYGCRSRTLTCKKNVSGIRI
jgi:hypothetical protein